MARATERFMSRFARVEREVRSRVPSLAYSSIEDGAITAYTVDGTQTMVIGQQADGTNTAAVVSGPTPPTPSDPGIQPAVQGILGVWDGTYLDGSVAPMDFARAEFHISAVGPDFIPDLIGENSSTMFGSIESPRGGQVLASPLPYVEHWIKIVIRSQSGKFSVASGAISAVPIKIESIDLADLSVTTAKIAQNAITSEKVDDFAITAVKYRSNTHQLY